jgi:glycosyltransferase involved in cell wall biosynthesis
MTADDLLISVIIPTFNRAPVLVRCLEALDQQTMVRGQYEVIIVDDGSTDDTSARVRPWVERGAVTYLRQDNSGPARARNTAVRASRGKLVLFIGDDIIADPSFLQEHVAAHFVHGQSLAASRIAVLGLTEWSPTIKIMPVMVYGGRGAQFDYHTIDAQKLDQENLPFHFFYTSNVSLGRAFMVDHQLFFDEDFTHAMGEDGELAYRLQQHDLRIVFHPKALAYHEHTTTFKSVCRRMIVRGKVSILQARKHPELADLSFLNRSWKGKLRWAASRGSAAVLRPMLVVADNIGWDVTQPRNNWLKRLYDYVLGVYETIGLQQGLTTYATHPAHEGAGCAMPAEV